MRRLVSRASAVALAAFLAIPAPAIAWHDTRLKQADGDWLHHHQTTIYYCVQVNNSSIRSALSAAIAEWNADTVLNFVQLVSCGSSSLDLRILESDVGSSYFQPRSESNGHWGVYSQKYSWVVLSSNLASRPSAERRAIACQEVGHAAGLDHAAGDCMGIGYFSQWSQYVGSHSASVVNTYYGSGH
jgi:hypothetical protein